MMFPKEKWKKKPPAEASLLHTPEECEIQAACENLLIQHGVPYFRIPDAVLNHLFGMNSTMKEWDKKEAREYLKDVPDLTIFKRDGSYFMVELKTETGNQRQGQRHYEKKVGEANYFIIRSVSEFINLCRNKGL